MLAVPAFACDSTSALGFLQRHWEETETETIWRDRYTNCDYGYYALLPSGVIGHGTHSPAPNHGFVVPLPDVGKTSLVSDDDPRLLFVNAEYNMSESRSLRRVADYQLGLASQGKATFRIVERKATTLDGLAAIRVRFEYDTSSSRMTELEVIALRSGIVYEVGLRTRQADYEHDHKWLVRIQEGFRLMSLPQGPCSND